MSVSGQCACNQAELLSRFLRLVACELYTSPFGYPGEEGCTPGSEEPPPASSLIEFFIRCCSTARMVATTGSGPRQAGS